MAPHFYLAEISVLGTYCFAVNHLEFSDLKGQQSLCYCSWFRCVRDLGKTCLGGLGSSSCHHMVVGSGTEGTGAAGGWPAFVSLHVVSRPLNADSPLGLVWASLKCGNLRRLTFLIRWLRVPTGRNYMPGRN